MVTLDSAGETVTVTLAHEKLLSAWTWLRKLVDENRDVIAVQNEIINDAKEWNENQRDDSFLYRGARLANVREIKCKKTVSERIGVRIRTIREIGIYRCLGAGKEAGGSP